MYKTFEFLMVEDDPGDIRLSREYLKDFRVSIRLNVVKDDAEALEFLRGQGKYALATQPDVILISIRELWRKEKSLLQQIKRDVTLAHIPLVILIAFEGEQASLHEDLADILCLSKPLNVDALGAIMSHIDDSPPAKTRETTSPPFAASTLIALKAPMNLAVLSAYPVQ